MERFTPTLRTARPSEMGAIIALDDDACSLFVEAGRGLTPNEHFHSFEQAEQARWHASLEAGRVVVAVNTGDEPIGFAALGFVDGEPHLQQISVARAWMKRGVGHVLMNHTLQWAGKSLWLTTYADIPWNRPFYERLGFACVSANLCGPEMRAILQEERLALPDPDQRVAMVRRATAFGH
jgi:GNAT superfamily N-acetyltransferase